MILSDSNFFTIPQGISAIAHVSIALIALANFFFAFYLLKYQRERDKGNQVLQRQNLRIEWLKELIIKPQWDKVEQYYKSIAEICEIYKTPNLTNEQKINALNRIKLETSNIRKSFIDRLNVVHSTLENQAKENLDKMIDGISNIVYNEGINLNHSPTFDREILNRITYSRNNLIAIIFSYNGDVDS